MKMTKESSYRGPWLGENDSRRLWVIGPDGQQIVQYQGTLSVLEDTECMWIDNLNLLWYAAREAGWVLDADSRSQFHVVFGTSEGLENWIQCKSKNYPSSALCQMGFSKDGNPYLVTDCGIDPYLAIV